MKYSFVVGFRNRDITRVERYLESINNQNLKDFELVFVDYGSDDESSDLIKQLIEKYDFAIYIYTHTKGLPWNRAHALNIGVRKSSGHYIIFSDIDLIYSDNFIQVVDRNIKDESNLYQQVYWLPENFCEWGTLLNKPLHFNYSLEGSKGGVHIVKKECLETLHGYDEFYCYWGLEDNDLSNRLNIFGLEEKWLAKEESPVYHQWHPIVSNAKKNFFPDKWYDDMLIYFSLNKENVLRNNNDWGKIYNKKDRSIFYIENFIEHPIPTTIVLNTKSDFIQELIQKIKSLNTNEGLVIRIPLPKQIEKYSSLLIFRILQKLNAIFRLKSVLTKSDYVKNLEYLNGNGAFMIPEKDIFYLMWKLIKSSDIIEDYDISYQNNSITIRIC